MKKRILQNILITIGILIIATILIFIFKPNNKPETAGSFTIILIDSENNEIFNDSYEFTVDDTLWKIIKENYSEDLMYNETTAYGIQLLSIGGIETDFINTYLSIYIDGKYSSYGLSNIKLVDGMKIELKETNVK